MTFDEIRGLAGGFQPARLLLTALDLGVFEAVADRFRTAREVAGELGLDARATEIAADALAALGLLDKRRGAYRCSGAARRWLVRASPEYRGEILRHLHNTWDDWAGLGRTWRTGSPARPGRARHLPSGDDDLRHFICGMENITRELAPRLAGLLPLEGCRTALDLGGGPGNYSLAFVQRWPRLHVVHFDLPPTSRIARGLVGGRPGSERITFVEGDFLRDPLGGPYDLIWASQIIHMLGEEEVRGLLARTRDALAPGGILAIHDHFLDPDRTAPPPAALFGVHMLVVTERGRAYALEEVDAWARQAGLAPGGVLEYGAAPRILLVRKAGRGG